MLKKLLGDLYTEEIAKKLEGKELVLKSDQENTIPKSRFDEVNNAKKDLAKQVKEYQADLEKLSKGNTDIEALKQQLADKSKEFTDYQENIEKQQLNNKKSEAIMSKLKQLNALNPKLLAREFELDSISFDDDGGLVGVKDTFERLQKEYSAQFGKVDTKAPDVNTGEGTAIDKATLSKMTYKERVAFKNENPTEYETLTK